MLEILILIGIYAIYKIVKEIVGNNKHLSDNEIKEYKYRRRSLSQSKQSRVTNHIGICEPCRERFMEIFMD